MIVHMIRHGKTVANEQKLYCGATDLSLSREGIAELNALKNTIIYPSTQLFAASGLCRTSQTIEVLYGKQQIHIVQDLNELEFGDFEMKSYEQLKNNPAYQEWINDIARVTPMNGESAVAFKTRVIRGFDEVRRLCTAANASVITVATHGGVIATLMEYLFPYEKHFYEWQPPCGMGYSITLDKRDIKYTTFVRKN